MSFFKTLFFFGLFASIAIAIRLAVFGTPDASKPLESPATVSDVAPATPAVSSLVTSSPVVSAAVPSSPDVPLRVVGYIMRGKSINLWLSDGRFLTDRDPELQEVRKNYAIIEGKRVWFVRPAREQNSPQPLPATRSEAERGISL